MLRDSFLRSVARTLEIAGVDPGAAERIRVPERVGFQVVETASAFRGPVVFATGVRSAFAFDDHLRGIRTEVSPEQKGECRFQITYARRP